MAVFSGIATAVASISTFVGSLGVVGSSILKAVVGIGLNKLAMKLSGKRANGPSFSVKGQLQRGADLPQSFIVGKAATAGSLTYVNTWGHSGKTPNAFLTMVISLSDLPCQSLDAVWVNGVRGTIADVPHETYGHPIPEFHRDGSDYVWVKPFMGDQQHASPYLINDVSTPERPWDATAIGENTAYVIVTFKVNQELFSGFPQVLFEVSGMPLYDPSRDSTVGGSGSHRWNDPATWGGDGDHLPAVQIYNLMRGITVNGQWFYGMQATTPAQLPAVHWIDQIEKCRAVIAANGGNEATYRSGGEIAVAAPIADAIEAMLDACQGRLSEAGGTYKLFVGAPGDVVAHFTDDDIISTQEQSFTPFFGLADTVNGISGKFPDPSQSWQIETAPPLLRDDLEVEDGARRLMADVSFDLVPYAEQVQRLMLGALNEARRARRHTFTLPPQFWSLEPGDVVSWTSERNGYDVKLFRVDGALDQPNADVVGDLTEVDPSDYDFDTSVDFTPVAASVSGGLVIPSQVISGWSVEGIALKDDAGIDRMAALRFQWDSDIDDVVGVHVQVRLAASETVIFDGRLEDVAAGEGIVSQSILGETEYEGRGRYIPGTARATDWSAWLGATTPAVFADGVEELREEFRQKDEEAREAFENYLRLFYYAFDRHAEYDIIGRARAVLDDAKTDGKIQQTRIELKAEIEGVSSTLAQDYVTAVTMNAALAQMSNTLTTQIGDANAQISETATSLSDINSAFASYQIEVQSDFDTVSAFIDQNIYTIAEADAAIAAQTSTLTTSLNGLTTTVQTVEQSVDGVLGLTGWHINNNGVISGIGQMSQLVNGQVTSEILLSADNVRFVNANGDGSATSPFQVVGNETYIKSANILDADIGTAKIAGNAITVPVSGTGSLLVGNGGYQLAASAVMSLPFTGSIDVDWQVEQGYAQSGPTWGFRILVNGTEIASRSGMVAITDYPSGVASVHGVSGLQIVQFEWLGSNSDITGKSYIRLRGYMR